MDLTSRKTIEKLLRGIGAKPSKRLGQNFLIDKNAVRQIIEAANLTNEDIVLEIGPGLGVITQELAKKAKKVIAVEKDQSMVAILKKTLKDVGNIEVVQKDILKISNFKFPRPTSPASELAGGRVIFKHKNLKLKIKNSYKVVANLPFYLTAPVIRQLLEHTETRPLYAVLVVQKEVGERISAKPPRMNLLAVSIQIYADAKIIAYISKKSFWPQPKVDAAIIKITPKSQNIQRPVLCMFFKLVKAGFSQPRKQLANNLSKQLQISKEAIRDWLNKNSIDPSRRAETLTIRDWINLVKSFKIK